MVKYAKKKTILKVFFHFAIEMVVLSGLGWKKDLNPLGIKEKRKIL